jgi:hypothetical protein
VAQNSNWISIGKKELKRLIFIPDEIFECIPNSITSTLNKVKVMLLASLLNVEMKWKASVWSGISIDTPPINSATQKSRLFH